MAFYLALTTSTPPGVGQTKMVFSPALFDSATGAYPKSNPPASVTYAVDGNGKAVFFASAVACTPFVITTGDRLVHEFENSHAIPANEVTTEQALWAAGKFSYAAATYSETQTGDQDWYGEVPAIAVPAPTKVYINGIAYAIASIAWGSVEQWTSSGTMPYGYQERCDKNAVVTLVGAPNLQSILSVGKTVYWA
jgi:hypothetical protein